MIWHNQSNSKSKLSYKKMQSLNTMVLKHEDRWSNIQHRWKDLDSKTENRAYNLYTEFIWWVSKVYSTLITSSVMVA